MNPTDKRNTVYLFIQPMHSRNKPHHRVRRHSPHCKRIIQSGTGNKHIVINRENCVVFGIFDWLKSIVQIILFVEFEPETRFTSSGTGENHISKTSFENVGRRVALTPDYMDCISHAAGCIMSHSLLQKIVSLPSVYQHSVSTTTPGIVFTNNNTTNL